MCCGGCAKEGGGRGGDIGAISWVGGGLIGCGDRRQYDTTKICTIYFKIIPDFKGNFRLSVHIDATGTSL
jgi:hypothetical protein